MQGLSWFQGTERKAQAILLVVTLAVYTFYFHDIFLHLNSRLSSITLDSLKNYYTFVYHVKNDASALTFQGMNYPIGEHVVYTDCQPLLGFMLRLMPFTHGYLIGILHFLLYASYIAAPLILYRIFRRLGTDVWASAGISLAVVLLCPQLVKINGGHHALGYACMIPLSMLLVLRHCQQENFRNAASIFIYNTLLFFIHPYMGFAITVFTAISLTCFFAFQKTKEWPRRLAVVGSCGIIPIVAFRLFMAITDHHAGRPEEPYGSEVMVENLHTLLAPDFGPFRDVLKKIFDQPTEHFEGHSYIGLFTILLGVFCFVCLPFMIRRRAIRKDVTALFIGSLVLLFIAFGWHHAVLNLLHIKSTSVNQFRAVSRFAYFFYFGLPVFVVSSLYSYHCKILPASRPGKVWRIVAAVFLMVNLSEANSYLKLNGEAYWKFRNFFCEKYLNEEERVVLRDIARHQPQAILPLPIFHGGSEMYDRAGLNNSMIPSMIYSFHSGLPIFSVMMSRTSIQETEDLIGMLNSYKKYKPLAKKFNAKDFFVLKTNDQLLPDEERLEPYCRYFTGNDTLSVGYLAVKDLLAPKKNKPFFSLSETFRKGTATPVIFIESPDRKPFRETSMDDYASIVKLADRQLPAGKYIVSFHYHYTSKVYRSLSTNLIVTRSSGERSDWVYNVPVRIMSGFYKGFGVFEYPVIIETGYNYEFILKGLENESYKISNFLLRPDTINTIQVVSKGDTIFNNFPK